MERRDAALLILVRDDGCILMQHRTEDAPRWPGYWGLFGGGIEKDETPEAAIRREIKEELNYTLIDVKLFLTMEVDKPDYRGTRHIFLARHDPGSALELREGQGMAWCKVDEALKLKLSDYNRITLEKYRDSRQ